MKEIHYLIRLRYIKPTKGLVVKKSKLAEFIPLVRKEEEIVKGNVDVRCRVFLPEFVELAKSFGFSVHNSRNRIWMTSDDREAYMRLLVYAVVRQNLLSEYKIWKLKDIVKELPLSDIRYWASTFRSSYERYGTRRELIRPAKAFKEVYLFD